MVAIFDINPSNASSYIKELNNILNNESKNIMYVVHKPGCPACESFMPKWTKFSSNLQNKPNNHIVLASIHVHLLSSLDLRNKEDIYGVPHIMLQSKNKLTEYHGNREPEDLEMWLLSTLSENKIGGSMKRKRTKKSMTQKRKKRRTRKANKSRRTSKSTNLSKRNK